MRASHLLLCGIVGIAGPLAGHAQAIHKCTAPDETVYQATPCAAGAIDDVLIASRAGARAELSPAVAAPAVVANNARRVFQPTSLAVGMSDDEVLNLPSWGRPSAITRSRSNRIWHEEWLYRWRWGGVSRLSFANGRLIDVEIAAAAPEAPVSVTLR